MSKFLTLAVMGLTVLGCVALPGCQSRQRSSQRAAALAMIKAILEDDQAAARKLLGNRWVPIIESEDRLNIGGDFYFPIHLAAREGRVAILEGLIRKDADIDARDDGGLTPVMWTFYANPVPRKAEQLDCLRLLSRSGADLNARSRARRETALHQAAYSGDIVFARELIKLGADVRLRRCDGGTALHLAADALLPKQATEPLDIAKALVEAGADVHAKNDAGLTAEDVAGKAGREKLVAFLREAAAKKAAKDPPGKP